MDQFIETAINIVQPVMESSIVLAGEYAKACGRDFVTGKDVDYALKYTAQTYVGKFLGTLFPELHDDDSDSDDSIEVIEENEENCFTRYEGEDETMIKINDAYDNWEEWKPTNIMEQMLQDAVNKNT
jgi:hypothetical protein